MSAVRHRPDAAEPAPEQPGPGLGEVVLRVTGVTKTYGPVRALDTVDLVLNRGEVVALAGENGSGKSTLSKVIAGVVSPDSGVVEVAGVCCEFTRPREALDAGVAIVSQEPSSVPLMTVAENVLLPSLQRALTGVRKQELYRRAAPYLRRVGLDVDPARPLASLPQGDRELVEVAKALAVDPKVLILDEVTTRLPDPERLFAVVESLAADGTAILFITHRLREIRRLASRAVILRDGQRVAELARDQLSDERIAAAMVGRELTEFFHKPPVRLGAPVLSVQGLVTDRAPTPLTFSVRAGEIVGVAGLVGAGRSELLETLAGARKARGGTVHLADTGLKPGSLHAATAAGVALVPEDRYRQALLRPASIVANLALPRHRLLGGTSRSAERRGAAAAVQTFGIRCAGVDAPVASLSGGNAQKVVMARALAREPRVLLLDEPTRGVDVGARSEIYALVAEQVTRGLAVLMASSDLLELIGLCDRVLVLHDGELVGDLDRREATEEHIALLSAGGRRAA